MERIINEIVENLKTDPKVTGVLLTGSRARGDAAPGSDVDFWVLLSGVSERRFRTETHNGQTVEMHFRNLVQARDVMRSNPMELYSHLDGRILHDPDGKLAELRAEAQAMFEGYQMPEAERRALAYWLESVRRKLKDALEQEAQLKMSYLVSTSSWKMLEGLWAANQKPLPPSGAVFAHLPKLQTPLPHFQLMQDLFNNDPLVRTRTALGLIDWVLPRIQ